MVDVESTLWMDMVDIRIFWNMVDWMDDMVDWMDDMVWKDKWIEPTSGMKTMAARLLSDKIIVLKHIVLLVLQTEWSRSGWPIIVCVNYYNYDQLYIDENNGYFALWRTHSTADAVSTVPSMLNLILCLFTIPDHHCHHNADDHNADDANFDNSNEKLWLWLKMAMKNENAPVSTMKGLTSIRWSLFPGWVCNVTKYQLVDAFLNMFSVIHPKDLSL